MSLVHRFSRRRSRGSTGAGQLIAGNPAEQPAWRRLLGSPDPMVVDAGAEGELLVARVRCALVVMLLPIPLINLLLDPDATAGLVGLATCLVALGLALGALRLLRREQYRPWLGLGTSLLDVSLVSAALTAFLVLGQPITTVNSRLVFEVYFLAIGATALRYDVRITAAAGLAAITQYLTLVLIAHFRFDLSDPRLANPAYGAFDWGTQISRLVLLAVATLLASAIVLRSQRLHRQSRSDRLTGLPNRSFFDDRIQAELARARRSQEPIALAMIDVDHFKKFNDTWGHAAGDVALRAVAQAILESIRESDMVVRYGGEEFVALFAGIGPQAAVERVEQIRRTVEQLPLSIPRRADASGVTISAGVALYGLDGTQTEDLLDQADTRLFEAKRTGRNRVCGPPLASSTARPESRASPKPG